MHVRWDPIVTCRRFYRFDVCKESGSQPPARPSSRPLAQDHRAHLPSTALGYSSRVGLHSLNRIFSGVSSLTEYVMQQLSYSYFHATAPAKCHAMNTLPVHRTLARKHFAPPLAIARQILCDNIHKRKLELASVKHMLNSFTVVKVVPDECLAEIFMNIAANEFGSVEDRLIQPLSKAWIVLSQVSSHWHFVTSSTPRVWSHLVLPSSLAEWEWSII